MILETYAMYLGQTVKLVEGGVYIGDFEITSSNVPYAPTGKILVGYGYSSKVTPFPPIANFPDRPGYGSLKRVKRVKTYLVDTVGVDYSVSNEAGQWRLSDGETAMEGFKELPMLENFSLDSSYSLGQDFPYPSNIVSLFVELDT
jgi:hypothetical protein